VWYTRSVAIAPVARKSPVAGSYNSAEAVEKVSLEVAPPATRTWPLGRSVAVWYTRFVAIAPVALKRPVAGLYNSAEARKLLEF